MLYGLYVSGVVLSVAVEVLESVVAPNAGETVVPMAEAFTRVKMNEEPLVEPQDLGQFFGWTLRDPRIAALIASFSMIVLSEPGDKTFFISAVMSMKHHYAVVFAGATTALVCMTVLSVIVGATLPQLIDHTYTVYLAIVLFLFFGIRMIYEAFESKPEEETSSLDDLELKCDEAESTQEKDRCNSDDRRLMGRTLRGSSGAESKTLLPSFLVRLGVYRYCNSVFIQIVYLVFLAEWGDRSQLATIAMAASRDALGAAIGASLGHCVCTALAVLGGRLLATQINERLVSFTGGITFLVFAGAYLVGVIFPS